MLSFVLRALAPGFMLAGAMGAAVTAASAATSSAQVEIKADLDRTDLKAGERQTAYLRIVIGAARRPDVNRAPMNIALVIDRSGSMSGYGRIENARRAAADGRRSPRPQRHPVGGELRRSHRRRGAGEQGHQSRAYQGAHRAPDAARLDGDPRRSARRRQRDPQVQVERPRQPHHPAVGRSRQCRTVEAIRLRQPRPRAGERRHHGLDHWSRFRLQRGPDGGPRPRRRRQPRLRPGERATWPASSPASSTTRSASSGSKSRSSSR